MDANHLYYAIPLLQVLCIAHLIYTRAHFGWFLLIFFAPGVGALIYLALEVLPRLRGAGLDGVALPLLPGIQLGRLERQLRFADTIDNRAALAEAYHRAGRHDDAIATYRPALTGIARSNPYLLYGFAQACLAAGRVDEALAALRQVPPASTERLKERTLLLARCLERSGDHAAAEDAYRAVARGFDGEEARCRYGLFLRARGRREEADELFRAILQDAEMSDRDYRRRQREWLREARARLREPAPPAPTGATR